MSHQEINTKKLSRCLHSSLLPMSKIKFRFRAFYTSGNKGIFIALIVRFRIDKIHTYIKGMKIPAG